MPLMTLDMIFTLAHRGTVDKANERVFANRPGLTTFLRPKAPSDSRATVSGNAAFPSSIFDLIAKPVSTGPGATINKSTPLPCHSACKASPSVWTYALVAE